MLAVKRTKAAGGKKMHNKSQAYTVQQCAAI
jgi:hypothetical protein